MKKFVSMVTCFLFLVSALVPSSAFATPISSGGEAGGAISSQLGQISEAAAIAQSFQTDLYTGRAQTSVPIFVPPGRRNLQPNLSLSYSSSGGNGWLGLGWGLDIGFIQRDVKKGVPKYDSTDKFVFSYQGVYSELVAVGTNEYRAKDEALFMKFIFDPTNNKWTVTDKSGAKHTFGGTMDSRQINSLGTFKWALSEVKDTLDNYMSVTYSSDGGEIYLSTIEYNGNSGQGFGHTHKVEFILQDRNDPSFSYITGARVDLKKRLSEIHVKVKINGIHELSRKYSLSYEYSPSSFKSRLKSVAECGTDGITCFPPINFSYQNKPFEFEPMTPRANVQGETFISKRFNRNNFHYIEHVIDLTDINGDGILDRLTASSGNTNWGIQKGGAGGFSSPVNFPNIERLGNDAFYSWVRLQTPWFEIPTELLDINGDGLQDRVLSQAGNTEWKVQLNNGGLGFDAPINFGPIQRINNFTGHDWTHFTDNNPGGTVTEFIDMNGDGLPDRILLDPNSLSTWKVQWNTGSGYTNLQDYGPILQWADDSRTLYIRHKDNHVDLVDLNGDGLPDRVIAVDVNSNWKVQWNTGKGFTSSFQEWGPIDEWYGSNYLIRTTSDNGERQLEVFDINGDGLVDRVQGAGNTTEWLIQFNTGTGFTPLRFFSGVQMMKENHSYTYLGLSTTDTEGGVLVENADIDADGLVDRIQCEKSNPTWMVQKNKGPYPDLLNEIDNGKGGKTKIYYTPSTAYDNRDINGKYRLPFPVQVVSKKEQLDGMGNTYTTNYSYKGGMYSVAVPEGGDALNREFRGFREVTVTDAAGTQTINTFGQEDHNKGKLLQTEVKDSLGNLFTKEVTTLGEANPYPGVRFVFVSQKDSYLYDGDSTYKQMRQTFAYDEYGNLASTIEEGDVSISGDSRKTVNTYSYNTTAYILNTLSKTTVYDTDLNTIKAERYFYYDGSTSLTTAPTKGRLTKQEQWLNTACALPAPGCAGNPTAQIAYDNFGNITTVTDARGFMTMNTYDAAYQLFLTTISNPASQMTQFTYDVKLAQLLTSTDPNSQITETQYDALGRATKVIAPLDSASEPTQEFVYEYPDLSICGGACVTKTTIKIKSSAPGETFTQLISYSFTDGLGREIQHRSPAEDSAKQIVSGIVEFDNRGLVSKQYTPYFENTATSYQTPVTSGPKATLTYDALGRNTRIDYPDATFSTIVFSDFVKSFTNPNGKQLRYTNDAYGRLIKVEEFDSSNTYATTYEYDVLNNLKKTTDHAFNSTVINYDSLSRKISMTDPDMGTWSYAYDANDNLTSQKNAKNATIYLIYDNLNRITKKDVPSGTDEIYQYDVVPPGYSGQTGYWVGRLGKVTDASGTHEFKYDKQGRVVSDKKTISGVAYVFDRTYDSLGRVRTLKYPDAEVVAYTYNNFGDVETIQGIKSGVTTDYVKDVNYNPTGQITFTQYGNNVTANYTYDSNTLQLNNILTKKPDGVTKLQDLSYSFDNNGNIAEITDPVNSMSQDFAYDDLNRLKTATGSAYGSQSFAYDSIGNMTNKAGRTMTYGPAGLPAGASAQAGPHAVTSASWTEDNAPSYCRDIQPSACIMTYDANGNMTQRGSDTFTYNSENQVKTVKTYAGKTGSYKFTLQPGWNVISFAYLPEDKSVANVLSALKFGIDYDQVSTWDSNLGSWRHWFNNANFNDFTEFEYGKSYEIYNKKATNITLTVAGKSPAVDITHSLKAGDNFISPAVKSATNITTVLSGLTLGNHYSDVKRLNPATKVWESYAVGQFTQFELGKGYNIIGLKNASFSYGKTVLTTTFTYDFTGARVKKAGSTTTLYLGKDYEKEGSVTAKHIFLGEQRIATKKSNGTIQFIHSDFVDSSNVITDASGNKTVLLEYDPFGQIVTQTGSVNPRYKYTGQEDDGSTKLFDYNARLYDPQLGRFITADIFVPYPEDAQAFNRYSYVRNNPMLYVDPSGYYQEYNFQPEPSSYSFNPVEFSQSIAQAPNVTYIGFIQNQVMGSVPTQQDIAQFGSQSASSSSAIATPGGMLPGIVSPDINRNRGDGSQSQMKEKRQEVKTKFYKAYWLGPFVIINRLKALEVDKAAEVIRKNNPFVNIYTQFESDAREVTALANEVGGDIIGPENHAFNKKGELQNRTGEFYSHFHARIWSLDPRTSKLKLRSLSHVFFGTPTIVIGKTKSNQGKSS